ncbi:hypothetical protein GQ55_3G165200 [Panicum hallii var. hallii]|uniref:F-box domain-containing protein n=1 Tax=Panicum hallii var. hallii TaxID=1504633 RepID=A0A2T7EA76_9POAL|nr:hypothetical protein GQ55_3G165200 [Panicum hallii var. hallii]
MGRLDRAKVSAHNDHVSPSGARPWKGRPCHALYARAIRVQTDVRIGFATLAPERTRTGLHRERRRICRTERHAKGWIDRGRDTPMVATPGATAAATTQVLNDDVLTEILLRLPPGAVRRFRAVCKAWYRTTTGPAFLSAYARRCPLDLVVVQRHGVSSTLLDTIPLLALDETRRRGYSLIGSCDGLLLFERGFGIDYFIYSPATRQWTKLPRPPGTAILLCGFYLHGPSGEHRILYFTNDQQGSHYVSSLQVAGGDYVPGEVVHADRILTFDTVAETFRRIPCPPRRRADRPDKEFSLLEMDGKLAAAAFLDGSMDLWVLEDYNNDESWARRLRVRVRLPPALRQATLAMKPGAEGQDVILLGDCWDYTVGLYHLTKKRRLKQIQLFTTDDQPGDFVPDTPLRILVFRDNLKRHTFLDSLGS